MITKNKRLVFIVLGAVTLLLVPFIAMQFSHEVSWSPDDFVVMGGLLLGTGLLCEFVLRKVKRNAMNRQVVRGMLIEREKRE